MDLNNLILFFVIIVFGLFFFKYFTLILRKYNPKILIDDQLNLKDTGAKVHYLRNNFDV